MTECTLSENVLGFLLVSVCLYCKRKEPLCQSHRKMVLLVLVCSEIGQGVMQRSCCALERERAVIFCLGAEMLEEAMPPSTSPFVM